MLYIRQILILFVTLYTVRVVLNVLGVEDYGIFNVVGGIVSFFSFLSATMASASQRFFSFAIGQNNAEKLNKTFTVNWIIYGVIAIVAAILLETLGLWFVNTQLNVSADRLDAVKWIYQFSILTFIISIVSTPFMSIIIAHEDMHIYAYVSIVEVILKLVVVFLLSNITFDKLELYGILLFVLSFIITSIYIIICLRKYKECQFKEFFWDKKLLKEIMGFTGWTLFGQVTSVGRNQAVTILLNQFFNPVVVAARAIAMNITNQITIFSNNFNTSLYPPIIKSYATEDKDQMFSLLFNGSKITFFLMWVFALPFFIEMDTILSVWLQNPPTEAVLFTRLALVEVLINSISLPLTTAARAPGKVKIYELILGSIQIGVFIASWVVLKLEGAAYTVFVVAIIANLIMFVVRLLILRGLIGLLIKPFVLKVVFPVLIVIVCSVIPSVFIHLILPNGFVYSIVSILNSILLSSFIMYFFGLDKQMRQYLLGVLKVRINKIISANHK